MTQTKVEAPFVENNSVRFKNFFINGDFMIAQRATGATAAGNGTYTTLDRMQTYLGETSGAYTTAQTALSAADQATTGQVFAYDIQCTTADTSIASNAYVMVRQRIEAQFLQSLLYGSSAAKTLTLSFWVKSNLTGTTTGCIIKADSTAQSFLFEYTINTTNTWEKKVIKVTPPSSGGTIDVNNGDGLNVQWNLHIGSTYLGGSNVTWDETNSYYGTTNTLNVLSSTSNDLFITGVQLEIGDQATDFEHLPFDIQLQRCQRYCEVIADGRASNKGTLSSDGDLDEGIGGTGCNQNTQYCYMPLRFATKKRGTAPSLTKTNDTNYFRLYSNNTNDQLDTVHNDGTSSFHQLTLYFDYGSTNGWTQGHAAFARINNANAYVIVTDEMN